MEPTTQHSLTHPSDDRVIGSGDLVEDAVVHLQRLGGLQRNLLLPRHIVVAQGTTQVAEEEEGLYTVTKSLGLY